MSSRCRLARLGSVLVVVVAVGGGGAREATFEAAQGLGFGGASVKPFLVVPAAQSVESDLGNGDPVQCGVELTVARAAHPDPAGSVARPHRDGRNAGMPGESRFG